jgi:sugar lactone lactonase YvrE
MPAGGLGKDLLYVTNTLYIYPTSVTVYGGSDWSLVRTITHGIKEPTSLALDPLGILYVLNLQNVTVYKNAGRKLLRVLTRDVRSPYGLALDHHGNLYVQGPRSVHVYVNGRERNVHTIRVVGDTIALDAADNLYVGTQANTVNVYAPGSRTPSRIISDGISYPTGFAFDAAGDLYVANVFGGTQYCGRNSTAGWVTAYAPGATSPFLTITAQQGICNPFRLAFDDAGDLYVANGPPGSEHASNVTVYAPSSSTLQRTITDGVDGPWALALDHAGNLYVANASASTVTVYAAGGTTLLKTISNGVAYPESIAIGP